MAPGEAPRTACFTIVSRNYLAFARTLLDSVRVVEPRWDPFVLLADEVADGFDPAAESFHVVEVASLRIPDVAEMLFRYSIVELNTAVKPWFFRWLFERGYERVLFLDPDVFVYAPLAEVTRAWDEGALAVLTPHLTGRLRDEGKPSERDILLSGSYNLGFLALARHPDLEPLLDYWCEKSRSEFVSDVTNGLFTDQRWMDLVPGMFDGVRVLRDEGYNVAYWNLPHRRLHREGERWTVNGVPLVFFHYSGLDPAQPEAFSKHQDRYRVSDLGVAAELVRMYAAAVRDRGLERCREWRYAFGRFRDGTPILDELRRLYHASPEFRRRAGPDPFSLARSALVESSDGAEPPVTWIMRAVHAARLDLREAFPDPLGGDRTAFARWFVDSAPREYALPADLVDPVRATLGRSTAEGPGPLAPPTAPPFRAPSERQLLGGALRKASVAWREGRLPWSPLAWMRLLGSHRRELRERHALDTARWAARRPPAPAPRARRSSFAQLAGFHDRSAEERGRGLAWVGSCSRVVLRGARPGARVIVRGEHDAELHRRGRGTGRLALRLELDGAVLAERTLEASETFELTATLPPGTPNGAQLWLECSHAIVPARCALGTDTRELGVLIQSVELDGHRLLDFRREAEPYEPLARREALPGLSIAGYLDDGTGVAQSAHACAAACASVGVVSELLDVRTLAGRPAAHPVTLLHVNADQTPHVHSQLGDELFRGRYTIGFWAWELEEIPDAYLASFDLVDEVWVPSQFVQRALAERSPGPVVYMPHCLTARACSPSRAALGLPEDSFLFLSMYDMDSVQERKNPLAALEAFARAFPAPRDVAFVLKVSRTSVAPGVFDHVRAWVAEHPGVHLIEGTWPRERVYDLEAACDAYVSLHRSEGFGLNLAECMQLGKPVVATHWSGNTEFMNHRNSCPVDYRLVRLERSYGPYPMGARWAEPDVDHAAHYMRRLVEDAAWRADLGERARGTIEEGYSPQAIGERYRRRLELIARA